MGDIEVIIRKKIKTLSIDKKLDGKILYLFGVNIFTEHINNCLYYENYKLSGIIDNDITKQGKSIYNILISAPESINWKQEIVVLIASRHKEEMKKQIFHLSGKAKIYELIDFVNYEENLEKNNAFWDEDNYNNEIKKLYQGELIYRKLKQKEPLVVFPTTALGDIFVGGLYFGAYKKKLRVSNFKIVVASKGAYKVAELFEVKNIASISEQEMDTLVKFLFFNEFKDGDTICSWGGQPWFISMYKRIPFAKYNVKYFYKLNDCQMCFPSIWDKKLDELELNKRIVKGKTIVLAPYANSMDELPFQFWEILVSRLQEEGYNVVTNIVGKQKPIKNTLGVEFPLNQIGSYLEFAGCFVSIRSGLCDVIGQAKCKQIIIFRDRECGFNTQLIECYDLHIDNVSENAIQYLYDDKDIFENIDKILDLIEN